MGVVHGQGAQLENTGSTGTNTFVFNGGGDFGGGTFGDKIGDKKVIGFVAKADESTADRHLSIPTMGMSVCLQNGMQKYDGILEQSDETARGAGGFAINFIYYTNNENGESIFNNADFYAICI